MVNILIAILQVVVVIAVAPFFSGLARVVRAKVTSRRGPDVWQDYRDIAKLLRRQEVRSSQSGPVLRVMPALFFAVMVVLAMVVIMILETVATFAWFLKWMGSVLPGEPSAEVAAGHRLPGAMAFVFVVLMVLIVVSGPLSAAWLG